MRGTNHVWTRLEPVTKDPDMTEGLRGAVSDPLWMLTRQWQLGEFEGEDAGSAVDVSVDLAHDELAAYQLHGRSDDPAPQPYEGGPLEAVAERENVLYGDDEPNARLAVQAGAAYTRLLERERGGDVDYAASDFPQGYVLTELTHDEDEPVEEAGRRFGEVVTGVTLDGHRVYRAIHEALDGTETWDAGALTFPWQEGDPTAEPTSLPVPDDGSAGDAWFREAARAFHEWYRNLYDEPTDETGAAWDPERLDYRFRVTTGAPGEAADGSSTETVLEAPEYRGDDLGWYSFDVADPTPQEQGSSGGYTGTTPVTNADDPTGSGLLRLALRSEIGHSPLAGTGGGPGSLVTDVEDPAEAGTRRVSKHVMPTRATFKGMPRARYWAFEDGDVRLDEIEVDDVADQVMVNFALVYGNDWHTFPVDTPLGALTRVTDLEVTDTFGVTESVPPVGHDVDRHGNLYETGDDWTMFTVDDLPGSSEGEPGLFTPPTLDDDVESDPVEKVSLVRDEMANLAFAVEQSVESPTGTAIDREEYVRADLVVEKVSPAEDPAEEELQFHNPGHEPVEVGGWTVTDGDRTFTFPPGTELDAETTVTLHTGVAPPGGGSDTDLYWGASDPLWHSEDTVVVSVYDADATNVASGMDRDTDPNLEHLQLRYRIPGDGAGAAPRTRYRLANDLPDHWFALRPVTEQYAADLGRDRIEDGQTGDVVQTRFRHYLELALVLDADSLDAATIAALPDPEGEILRPYPDDDGKNFSIPREELPGGGKTITRRYRLATWTDGTAHLWSGRRVTRGADDTGSSTLRYDVMEGWEGTGG